MKASKMARAESARYTKIQRLMDLLYQKDNAVLDGDTERKVSKPFIVGMRIRVDGNKIIIKNKAYDALELRKVTINTEGSLAIYNRSSRKLCGWTVLNLSVKNIELFCIWVRKNNIHVETVSGKGERAFQIFFFVFAVLVMALIKILYILI